MRFDPFQIQFPAQVLPVNFAHIGYEERILLSCITSICIDTLNALVQSRLGQGLPIFFTMIIVVIDFERFFVKVK